MALRRHPSGHPHHLRHRPRHLHSHSTPLRPSQDGSTRSAGTYREGLSLPPLSDKGAKAALMFILFHKRVCGPMANSLFHHRPDQALKPASKVETAYYNADYTIQQVLELLAT